MDNFVKIPTDFESLHEVKDLGNLYSNAISFLEKISNYQESYFKSFIKSFDEVSEIIPENQRNKYDVCLVDQPLCKLKDFKIDLIKLNQICDHLRMFRGKLITERKNFRPIASTEKIFLIDTINKKINVCVWIGYRYASIRDYINDLNFNLSYGGDWLYKIDPKTNIFKVIVNLGSKQIFTDEQLRKSRDPYSFQPGIPNHGGHEVHYFCLRTNQYLGYNDYDSNYYHERKKTFTY